MSDYLPRPRLDPEPPRIDEASRRRRDDEFLADGNWIELLDGQKWCVPRPLVRLHAGPAEEHGFGRRFAWGPDYDARAEEFRLACEAEDFARVVRAQLDLARFLLTINYELTEAEFDGLVGFSYGEGVADPLKDALMATAMGADAPKPTAAG